MGKQVYVNKTNSYGEINISNVSKGLYIYKIEAGLNVKSGKLVVK